MRLIILITAGFVMASQAETRRMVEQLLMMQEEKQVPSSAPDDMRAVSEAITQQQRMVPPAPKRQGFIPRAVGEPRFDPLDGLRRTFGIPPGQPIPQEILDSLTKPAR